MAKQTITEIIEIELNKLKHADILKMCLDYKTKNSETEAFLNGTIGERNGWPDDIKSRMVSAMTGIHIQLASVNYDKYLRDGNKLDDEIKDCLVCSYARVYQRKINEIFAVTGSYNELMTQILDKFTPHLFITTVIRQYGNPL